MYQQYDLPATTRAETPATQSGSKQIVLALVLAGPTCSEGFPDGLHCGRVSLAGRSLDGLHRSMEKLVHQASGQGLNRRLLFRREALQAVSLTAQFSKPFPIPQRM